MVNPPAVDTALTLHFDADVLSDLFQNTQSAPWDVAFDWPSAETVVLDSTAPEVRRVRVVDGYLEIELSEKPDMATVAAAIDVASTASLGSSSLVSAPVDGTDSQEVTWNLAGDDKTLRTFDPLAPGTFILTIGPSLSDLVGTQLAEQFQKSFTTTVTQDDVLVFEEPDEKVTPISSVDNVLGFHGLPRDLETGFLYVRNRYYDPELGRFISADPLGYVDGPSMYGFAGYSPMNYGDPLGLSSADIRLRQADERLLNPETRDDELAMHYESQEALATVLANPYVQGGFQVTGGCLEAFFGGAAILTGVGTVPGAVALAHGSDLCGTGITAIWTGETQETLFFQKVAATFEWMGFDEDQARMAAIGTDLLGTISAGRAVQRGSQPAVSRSTARFPGSGPAPGVIEVSDRFQSVGAFSRYNPRPNPAYSGERVVEFVFDPTTNRFAVGRAPAGVGSPHQRLALAIQADEAQVLGGTFSRGPGGRIMTTEISGHYGDRWTPDLARQFVTFLENRTGQAVVHSAWP